MPGENDTMPQEQLETKITALFALLSDLYTTDNLLVKAGKLDILDDLEADDSERQLIAIQKIVFDNPKLDG
ncbi:MAG: hypothetical protein ACQEP9_09735, partial [Bacillota bacterium]